MSALGAVDLTFSAARFAFDRLSKLSPLEATFTPFPSRRRHRYFPETSAVISNLAFAIWRSAFLVLVLPPLWRELMASVEMASDDIDGRRSVKGYDQRCFHSCT
jgi:hypothetical protein